MATFRRVSVSQAAAIAALLTCISAARAELLIYEPFDYSAGAALNGLGATGQNLTGSYSTSSIQDLAISSPGLNYGSLQGSLPGVVGNRLDDLNGVGAGVVSVALDHAISIGAGQEIYFSALFTFSDATGGNRFARVHLVDSATSDELSFGEASVGVRAVRVTADTVATGDLIAAGADGSFTDGETLWLIGRYFNGLAPGSDALQLVGYSTAIAQSIAPSFDLTDPDARFAYSITGDDIDFTQITSLRFEVRGDGNNALDEVRIGTTYSEVVSPAAVPEPASGMLLVAGATLFALRNVSRRAAQRTTQSLADV